jgi:shikimate 5-dehydrogenase
MTRFLREAQEHGHQVINGKDMLIEQGAESFFRWTGIEPHRPSMEEAFDSFWESR